MTDFTTLLGALAILLPATLAGLHVFIRRRLAAEARAEWIERQSAKPATIEGVTEAEFIRLFVLSHAPRWMLYAAGGLAAALAATPVALFVIPFVYNQVWLLNGAPDWAGETGYVYQFTPDVRSDRRLGGGGGLLRPVDAPAHARAVQSRPGACARRTHPRRHRLAAAPEMGPARPARRLSLTEHIMEFLHAMVRVSDVEESLRFYCEGLGLKEIRRTDSEAGRFTLIFLASADDMKRGGFSGEESPIPAGLPCIELTHNWDPEDYDGGRNFGHLAWRVQDIYALCARLQGMGYEINRPPRDGRMAFVKSPDGISFEFLQAGDPLPPAEPWASMENSGSW